MPKEIGDARRCPRQSSNDGQEIEPLPADCVATDTMDILPTTTAERALPQIALELHPELKGTVWHRIGWRSACTELAGAVLDDERVSISFARAIARAVCCSGQVVALDGKVLVQGDTSIIYTDRAFFVMRCNDGG